MKIDSKKIKKSRRMIIRAKHQSILSAESKTIDKPNFDFFIQEARVKMDVQPPPFIKTIEWDMMDKERFFPLSMLSSFSVRCCFYPLTLIKTQLQVQFKNDVYTGLYDAAYKIYKTEGARGLYKGFWISSVQIFSGVFYISTYEGVRHLLAQYGAGDRTKSLVAGGTSDTKYIVDRRLYSLRCFFRLCFTSWANSNSAL